MLKKTLAILLIFKSTHWQNGLPFSVHFAYIVVKRYGH